MKLSAFLLSVLTVSSASAFATSSFPSSTDLKIPGDSPLELCNKEHRADIIHIDRVDLNPNPPEAGHELIIKAKGTVHQTIEEGAYVLLVVKYGLIKLLTQKADLCEQITNVNMECPIEKGAVELTKSVELPNEIPPVRYMASFILTQSIWQWTL